MPGRCALHIMIIFFILNLLQINAERSFTIDYENNCFRKDGQPFRYVSGSLHYFRVPHAFWKDRMMKMKAAGLNALQTYIEWNHHEPEPGVYNFQDDYDLITFLQTANDVGLLVVLRPGPYIDAEREFGGFPYWLLRENMKLRTNDPDYLYYVDRWLSVLLPMLKPLLYINGGPIITIQVENEYGSYYACDFAYTVHLREVYKQYFANDVVLFTTDGSNEAGLTCGKIDGVFAGVDFGSGTNVTDAFHHQQLHQSAGPLLNSEYYPGWLDHWGEPHQTRTIDDVCKTLDEILAVNASVNIYMFHGGTSFGFSNGANLGDTYQPCPTSYDYDAPLSEAGDPTPKYFAMREIIGKYLPLPLGPVPPASNKMSLGSFEMNLYSTLWNVLKLKTNKYATSRYPLSFEELGQAYGFVFYTTTWSLIAQDPAILKVPGLRDRGYVFVDHVFQGVLDRGQNIYTMPIMIQPNQNISILVENQGRISFGSGIYDRKGIIENVTLDSITLTGWTMHLINLHGKDVYKYLTSEMKEDPQEYSPHTPSFFLSIFKLPSTPGYPYDTFLKLDGWHKGVAFLNEFNLGRYWPIVGPQVTLYVPSVYFQPYEEWNVIAVFELEHAPCSGSSSSCYVEFVKDPIIDGPTPD